jgi:uncharacterized protein with ACT and thioredoxin-like domain
MSGDIVFNLTGKKIFVLLFEKKIQRIFFISLKPKQKRITRCLKSFYGKRIIKIENILKISKVVRRKIHRGDTGWDTKA